MICYLLRVPDSPHALRNKHTGAYSYDCTSASESWSSLNRQKAGLPNDVGMRLYAVNTLVTQLGDKERVLDITAVAAERLWSDLDTAPMGMSPTTR
jgi:hypothetical protein